MRLLAWLACIGCAIALLSGCGGGGDPSAPVDPVTPPTAEPVQVGPFLIRAQSAAGFRADAIPSQGHASFVALSGTTIDYLAVQELMDRIVFTSSRAGADYDVYVCDFFGENVQKLTNNDVADEFPAWSHDGRKIAWGKQKGDDFEIAVMNADGSSPYLLTDNLYNDSHPTWSPDGRRIAYESNYGGDYEIVTKFAEGGSLWPLTENTDEDRHPDWDRYTNRILFCTDREGDMLDVYRMDGQGQTETPVTDAVTLQALVGPTWAADGFTIAYHREVLFDPLGSRLFTDNANGSNQQYGVVSGGSDQYPCYSTDGEFLICAGFRSSTGSEIYAKETAFPYRVYQITNAPHDSAEPDAGSPVPTVRRVLIGPAGADHGYDPVFSYSYAGIAAFGADGYLSFVRLGIPAVHAGSILVTPLSDVGLDLVAVRIKATQIANARQDTGPGRDPYVWEFGASAGAVVIYLDADTGQIASVLVVNDSAYPAGADAGGLVAHTLGGDRLQVTGDLTAVYDDQGALVAEGVGAVEFDGARLVRAF